MSLIKLIDLGIPLPFLGIKNHRSFIYVENLVSFITACIEKKSAINKTFLVSDLPSISTPQLIKGISNALQKDAKIFRLPLLLIKALSYLIKSRNKLDKLIEEEGVTRIPGPHCYEFFMGREEFEEAHADEPGCFYLTDYLARHFDRVVLKGLGLDRFPELLFEYFKNYKKLIYIAQTDDSSLELKARQAADRLGLQYERRIRGYGELGKFMASAVQPRA